MKKAILITLISLLSGPIFAEAPVFDRSNDYAKADTNDTFVDSFNDSAQSVATNSFKDSKPMVIAKNEPRREGYPILAEKPVVTKESDNMQLLLGKLDALRQEVQDLRGKVEMQAYQIKRLKNKPSHENKMHKAIAMSLSTPSKSKTSTKPRRKSNDPMDEQLSYVGAFELVKNKQFDKAIPAMKQFLTEYPKGPYAANAHYWLGELFLLKHRYSDAMDEFNTIVDNFADSSKVAAAKLKLGITYAKLGDTFNAKQQFISVTEQFPDTSAARLAKARLANI